MGSMAGILMAFIVVSWLGEFACVDLHVMVPFMHPNFKVDTIFMHANFKVDMILCTF